MQTTIKVRGYHLDVYQHVNNARYLEFLEEARWAWLEESEAFHWMNKLGMAFVVVNININYRRPAVMGDVLVIDSQLMTLGGRVASLISGFPCNLMAVPSPMHCSPLSASI
ncbi:hypothetical protein ABMA09_05505 [Erwinia rhapontici]